MTVCAPSSVRVESKMKVATLCQIAPSCWSWDLIVATFTVRG
jgi:hypothetical protein